VEKVPGQNHQVRGKLDNLTERHLKGLCEITLSQITAPLCAKEGAMPEMEIREVDKAHGLSLATRADRDSSPVAKGPGGGQNETPQKGGRRHDTEPEKGLAQEQGTEGGSRERMDCHAHPPLRALAKVSEDLASGQQRERNEQGESNTLSNGPSAKSLP
jgi:hypothetical protein